LKILFFAGKA